MKLCRPAALIHQGNFHALSSVSLVIARRESAGSRLDGADTVVGRAELTNINTPLKKDW